MHYPIRATPAPAAKVDSAKTIALFYAAFLVVFSVAQLFSFEEFIELIASFGLPLNEVLVGAIAPTIVALEVFAIPFLLRMALSPGFRWVSMVCGWLVAAFWLALTLWIMTSGASVETVGFLGTVLDLIPGWWAVSISLFLGLMAAWASWGMWPATGNKK